MALIKCPDCGKEVSDKSTVCINCGCPLEVKEEKKEIITEYSKKENKKNKAVPFIITGVIIFLIVIVAVAIALIANSGIEVPSLYGVTEETATTILTSKSLIPNIVYEYDDTVKEGTVIQTNPWSGERVSENSTIEVIVSKGPSYISAKDSNLEWWHIDYYKEDNWEFVNPYIKEGYLYIECTPTFGVSFNWKDHGYGTASINDTFSKSVPLDLEVSNTEVQAGVEQTVTLIIPTNDLDVKKPTTLYTLLSIERNGKFEEIKVNFRISW